MHASQAVILVWIDSTSQRGGVISQNDRLESLIDSLQFWVSQKGQREHRSLVMELQSIVSNHIKKDQSKDCMCSWLLCSF